MNQHPYRPLSLGHKGEDVKRLQAALLNNGYPCFPDGDFGTATRSALVAYQQDNGLAADGVAGVNTYAKLFGVSALRQPKYLMLHTTATYEGDPRYNAEWVRNLHVNVMRWGRAGYSRVVEYDGSVVQLHPIDLTDGFQPHEITYGAAEYNPESVHICYIGGLDRNGQVKDTRTERQKAAMLSIVKEVIGLVPNILVGGHNQFHNKACPCFSVPRWLVTEGIPAANIYKADPFGYVSSMKG